MGDLVNLRAVRKAKARVADEAMAAENRARFGRTKGQKQAEAVAAERLARAIEGARRES